MDKEGWIIRTFPLRLCHSADKYKREIHELEHQFII